MRLAYLIELVVTCAVGLAGARWVLGDWEPVIGNPDFWVSQLDYLVTASSGFVGGAALVGCVGLIVEVVRHRTPRPWGLGRWVGSVVGLMLVVYAMSSLASGAVYQWIDSPVTWPEFWTGEIERLPRNALFGWRNNASSLIVALAIVRRMGSPGRVDPDAREWAGRVLAVLLAALSFASDVLMSMEQ